MKTLVDSDVKIFEPEHMADELNHWQINNENNCNNKPEIKRAIRPSNKEKVRKKNI